jgi:hypothetical protein
MDTLPQLQWMLIAAAILKLAAALHSLYTCSTSIRSAYVSLNLHFAPAAFVRCLPRWSIRLFPTPSPAVPF